MILDNNSLIQYLTEHGDKKTFGVITKIDTYVYNVRTENTDLVCGYFSIDIDGKVTFIKTSAYIRYNVDRNTLQKSYARDRITWRDFIPNTEGLYNEIFVVDEDLDELALTYKRSHPAEIINSLTKVISYRKKDIRKMEKDRDDIKIKIDNMKGEINRLCAAIRRTGIPLYMENIKSGDKFETRNGVIVVCKRMYSWNGYPVFGVIEGFEKLDTISDCMESVNNINLCK